MGLPLWAAASNYGHQFMGNTASASLTIPGDGLADDRQGSRLSHWFHSSNEATLLALIMIMIMVIMVIMIILMARPFNIAPQD